MIAPVTFSSSVHFSSGLVGTDRSQCGCFTFAGHVFNWVGVTHIIFSIGLLSVIVWSLKYFQKLNSGRLTGRCFSPTFCSYDFIPSHGLTPPLFDLPWYENVSEIFGL